MQFVVRATDCLIFLLALAAVARAVRHAPSREAWRRVGQRPAAMASTMILLVFAAIGFLDSLHYREQLPPGPDGQTEKAVYSSEVLSALDALLTPLRVQTEKTYSAPFARVLFQRETVELPGGGQARIYPRLVHGASHLRDGAAMLPDFVRRLLWTPFAALLVPARSNGAYFLPARQPGLCCLQQRPQSVEKGGNGKRETEFHGL